MASLGDASANLGEAFESANPEVRNPAYGGKAVDGLGDVEGQTHVATDIRGFNKTYFEPGTYDDLTLQ